MKNTASHSTPVAIFLNKVNINPNLVNVDEIDDYLRITKQDSLSITNDLRKAFFEEDYFELLCIGNILSSKLEYSDEDVLEAYQKIIKEIRMLEEGEETLEISVYEKDYSIEIEKINLKNYGALGNGDILLIGESVFHCFENKIHQFIPNINNKEEV